MSYSMSITQTDTSVEKQHFGLYQITGQYQNIAYQAWRLIWHLRVSTMAAS